MVVSESLPSSSLQRASRPDVDGERPGRMPGGQGPAAEVAGHPCHLSSSQPPGSRVDEAPDPQPLFLVETETQ